LAGYTRQSTYTDGDIIQADDSNNEFDQLETAFNINTGHAHDGSSFEGPIIKLIGDPGSSAINKVEVDSSNNRVGFFVNVSSSSVEQIRVQDGVIIPVTNDDVDLGSVTNKFKDGFFSGDLSIDGTTTFVGDITLGEIDSDFIPNADNTYDLGSSTKEWKDLYLDGTANIDTLTADSGTVAGSAITTLDNTQTLTNKSVDLANNTFTGTFAQFNFAVSDATLVSISGTETLTNKTLTSPDINSPNIDGGTVDDVTFTTQDDLFTLEDQGDTTKKAKFEASGISSATTHTFSFPNASGTFLLEDNTATFTNKNIDLTDNTVSGTLAEFNAALSDGSFASLAGAETLTNKTINSSNNTVTLDLTSANLSGTLAQFNSAVSDATLVSLSGTETLTNKTLTSPDVDTPDIDGGTIDGTTIGGTTPAAVTGTTGQFNTSLGVTGNITVTGTVDGRDVASDGSKLDGIESGATADQTAGEIKTAYESNADTNAFTDSEKTKLSNIESNADVTDTANVTAAGAAMTANNLSDLDNAATARTNIDVDQAGTALALAIALG